MSKKEDGRIVQVCGKSYSENRLRNFLNPDDPTLAPKHTLIVIASIVKDCIAESRPLPWQPSPPHANMISAVRGSVFDIVRQLKTYGPCGWTDVHDKAVELGFEGVADLVLLAVTTPRQ